MDNNTNNMDLDMDNTIIDYNNMDLDMDRMPAWLPGSLCGAAWGAFES